MRTKYKHGIITIGVLVTLFISCERDFDIKLKNNEPQLIVEAYINNELPTFNYVVLGRSQNYFEPALENVPVTGALVSITEGVLLANNTYSWDAATRRELKESRLAQLGNNALPGLYFDPMLATDPTKALIGKPGKYYLLEIEEGEQRYTAITALLQPVTLDSITAGNHFIDDDNDTLVPKARLTLHYKDPDTIGNTQLYYWRSAYNFDNFGWGGAGANRYAPNTDDLTNGQYMRTTLGNGFEINDSVNFHLASVERKVYNFWDSFNKARQNGGPFSTPVKLQSTITGPNVIGCFSGFSLSTKTVIVR